MRVYTKKDYYIKDFGETLIGCLILFGIPIGISIGIVLSLINNPDILDFLSSGGLILLVFDLFFIFVIIVIIIIKCIEIVPKKYKLKLEIKKEEEYFNQKITNMLFMGDYKEHIEYYCYSIGQNNLKTNEEYTIKIKNGDIYSVDTNEVDEIDSRKKAKKIKKEERKFARMLKKTRAKNSVLTILLTTMIIFFSILVILKNILDVEGSIINEDDVPIYIIILFPTIFLEMIIFSIRKYYLFKKYYTVSVYATCLKIEKVESYADGDSTISYYPKWEFGYNGRVYQITGSGYRKKDKIKDKYLYINPKLVGTGDECFDLENEKSDLLFNIMLASFFLFPFLLIGIYLLLIYY